MVVSERLQRSALLLGIAGLVLGIVAGYHRLGWDALPLPATLPPEHGALMTGSFFGTLIALERAIALRRRWAYLPAWLCGASLVGFLSGHAVGGYVLLALGGCGMAGLFGWLLRRYRYFPFALMFSAALLFAGGWVALAVGQPYVRALPLLMGFFVLTIVAERLELTRFVGLEQQALRWLLGLVAVLLLGIGGELFAEQWQMLGIAVGSFGVWLLRYDVALRMAWRLGVQTSHRYIAALLGLGYSWLLVTMGLMLPGDMAGLRYDAAVHAFFVGFVFAMVFAHGIMIVPALMHRLGYAYTAWLWIPVGATHGGLLLRLLGDWGVAPELRLWGSWLSGAGIVLFLAVVMVRTLQLPPAGRPPHAFPPEELSSR